MIITVIYISIWYLQYNITLTAKVYKFREDKEKFVQLIRPPSHELVSIHKKHGMNCLHQQILYQNLKQELLVPNGNPCRIFAYSKRRIADKFVIGFMTVNR